MCGLHGEIRFDGRSPDLEAHGRVNAALTPRGPDADGLYRHGPILLGHRRLKIIDLSEASQQPLVDPALGLAVVFNGCVYNHRELRADLEAKGYTFFSHGDTEVILKAYHAWGPDCVKRFNGMFAFAIHERDSNRLFLARDRLGIKPLYYEHKPSHFRFASSLPALTAGGGVDTNLDTSALHHYLSWHAVVPAPHTVYQGVRKLPPATTLMLTPDGEQTLTKYWAPTFATPAEHAAWTLGDWKAALHDELRAATRRRLVADVPVGVLLSGGVDSSVIVALLHELGATDLQTFSVGFESIGDTQGDEFRYSTLVAETFDTTHRQIFVDKHEVLATLDETIEAMAEPMVSHDVIGFYILSREVSKYVKVVQSGQGADEVFAGYHWYPPLADATDPVETYCRAFFDRDHADMAQLLTPDFMPASDVSREFVERHFAQAGADDPVAKALRLDTSIMLVDDPVKRVDNMTMAWGLEARVPFLDHELVEFAATIPSKFKLGDGGKQVLKALARDLVPAEVIDRPKGYFPVPALKYLRGSVLDKVRDALNSPRAHTRHVLQRSMLDAWLDAPDEHITKLGGSKLWQVGLLELWLQQSMDT